MAAASAVKSARRMWETQRLRPDFALATRATLGFMIPLLIGISLQRPLEGSFAALAAQNIAMVDVRGAYGLRVGLLASMTMILAAAVASGALVSHHLFGAVALTAALTLASGVWRHVSSDYGPSLSISSLLVLFLALAGPEGTSAAVQQGAAVVIGGVVGILLQVAYWPIHPQHPLRRTVAESWLAAADLFSALAPGEPAERAARHDRVTTAENALRTAIDHAAIVLVRGDRPRRVPLIAQLETLNLCAARLALRVSAFNTALESCMSEATFAPLAPALHPVLTSLTNTSRAIALAVVSRQPGHFAACEVRLRRAHSLLRVLQSRLRVLATTSLCHAQLEEILQSLLAQLPEIRSALQETSERAGERAAFSLELFDLKTWMLRPLAATLNFSSRPDPGLVRFTLRLTVLTTLGVLAFKLLRFPHGYWLPFTMVVVLQPDYGATRQRAAQRVLGTAIGSIAASALLWVHFPPPVLLGIIALCVFTFAYTVRRYYAFAIFFVTVFVVLLMETAGPVTVAVALERVFATVIGGLLAWGAAALFWPLWERERFPAILAAALRANAEYLEKIADRLSGEGGPIEPVIAAKRQAENANADVFASLRRMFGDPQNRRERVQQAAALANGNQRLTRIFNLLFLHQSSGEPRHPRGIPECAARLAAALRALADAVLHPLPLPPMTALREELDRIGPEVEKTEAGATIEETWLTVQFGRAATELSAMSLAAEGELPSVAPPILSHSG